MSGVFLLNEIRYLIQIFRVCRPMFVDMTEAFSLFCDEKHRSSSALKNWDKKRHDFFVVFFEYLFSQKYFVKTYRTKKLQKVKIFHLTLGKRGWPLKLRAERALKYSNNIFLMWNILLYFIEAIMFILTFCTYTWQLFTPLLRI